MLAAMRSKSRLIMSIFIVPLILVFVAFFGYSGINAGRQYDRSVIVKVNGHPIHNDYYQLIRDQYQKQASRSNQALDADRLDLLAWDDVIRAELLRETAMEMGMAVSRDDVLEYVRNMFRAEDGSINEGWFQAWYMENFPNEELFYYLYGNVLRFERFSALIRSQAKITEAEVRSEFERRNAQREIEWVQWTVADYESEIKNVTEEIEAFYEQHAERYRLPDQIKAYHVNVNPAQLRPYAEVSERELNRFFAQYKQNYMIPQRAYLDFVAIDPVAFKPAAQATITEASIEDYYTSRGDELLFPERRRIAYVAINLEEAVAPESVPEASLETYYQANQARFRQKEQVHVRRILLPVTVGADEATRSGLTARLAELVADVTDSAEFARVADEHSQDPLAAEGGDLGWFSRQAHYFELESRAFAMEPGTLSKPFITPEGVQILYLDGKQPEHLKPLEQVRDEVLAAVRQEAGRAVAEDSLGLVRTMVGDAQLSAATQALEWTGGMVVETIWFGAQDPLPGLPDSEMYPLRAAAQQLELNQLSELIKGQEAYYLVQLIGIQPEHPKTLDEAREEVAERLADQVAEGLAQEQAEAFRAVVAASTAPFGELAAGMGLSASESEPVFENIGQVNGMGGVPRQWGGTVVAREVGEVVGPERMEKGWIVYRVGRKTDEYLPELEEVLDRVRFDALIQASNRMGQRLLERVMNQLDEPGYGQLPAAAVAVLEQASAAREVYASGGEVVEWSSQEAQAMLQVSAEETDWFAPDGAPAGTYWGQEVREYIKGMKELRKAPTTLVLETDGQPREGQPERLRGVHMFELTGKRESHIPALDTVWEQVSKDWRHVEAAYLAFASARRANGLLVEAATEVSPGGATRAIDLEAWAGQHNVKYVAPQLITDTGHISGLGPAQAVATTAFALQPGALSGVVPAAQTITEGTRQVEVVDHYVILQVISSQEPDAERYLEERKELYKSLAGGRQHYVFEAWLEELKARATIEPNAEWEARLPKLRPEEYPGS